MIKLKQQTGLFPKRRCSIYVDEENLGSLSGTTLEFVDGPNGKDSGLIIPINQNRAAAAIIPKRINLAAAAIINKVLR